MEKVKERITHYSLYVTALLKWLAVGALVGLSLIHISQPTRPY